MPQTLDPQVVNLAKAIRQTESGSDFTAKGKSGEYGAYQYTEPTWEKDAAEAGVNVALKDATLEQQNQVAYTKIKKWKDAGYNPGQIASMWNAGEEEPDAYQGKFSNGSPSIGVNKYGVKFDVPAYAKSVATAYQTLKQGGNVQVDPNNPSSIAAPSAEPNPYGALLRAEPSDTPLTAGLKSAANVPTSTINLAKNFGLAVLHPINTAKSMAETLFGSGEALGRGLEQLFGRDTSNIPQDEAEQKFNQVKNMLLQRYGSLDKARTTAEEDPMGFGSDVLSVLYAGAGVGDVALGTTAEGLTAEEAASRAASFPETGLNVMPQMADSGLLTGTLNKGVSAVGSVGAAPINAVGRGLVNVGSAVAGAPLGVGPQTIRGALSAVSKGGDAYKAYLEGLSGNLSQEDLVNQTRDALQTVVNQRQSTYQQMLSALKADPATYDITPALTELQKQLTKFGVKISDDGTLDFSRSAIGEGSDASKIEQIYNDLKSWGTQKGDRTAIGLDTLKRRIGNYYSPNSDVRAFVTATKNAVRGILEDAPGYSDQMKQYSDLSDNISDIKKGLSLGDNAMVETSFKKIMGAYRQNNEFRKQLLQGLDDATGGTLLPKIAGTEMSSLMPRGLMQRLEPLAAGGALATTGGAALVPVLISMMVTSPKLVGQFIRTLRLPIAATKTVMQLLDKSAATIGAPGVSVLNIAGQNNPQPNSLPLQTVATQ